MTLSSFVKAVKYSLPLILAVACSGASSSTPAADEIGQSTEAALRTTPERGATCEETAAWLETNKGRLPTMYDAVVGHSTPYRRAIFDASSPAVRSDLWTEHLNRYAAGRADLTASQLELLERVKALAAKPSSFDLSTGSLEVWKAIETEVRAAFGQNEATRMLATLGDPDDSLFSAPPALSSSERASASASRICLGNCCSCSTASDYCAGPMYRCRSNSCVRKSGCGTAYVYTCNGQCYWNW